MIRGNDAMIVRGNDGILGAVQDIDAQLTSEDEDDVVQVQRTRRLGTFIHSHELVWFEQKN